jgi:hypothetical protein
MEVLEAPGSAARVGVLERVQVDAAASRLPVLRPLDRHPFRGPDRWCGPDLSKALDPARIGPEPDLAIARSEGGGPAYRGASIEG